MLKTSFDTVKFNRQLDLLKLTSVIVLKKINDHLNSKNY